MGRTAKVLERHGITVPVGAWGAVTLALLGIGVPLALGSPALGIMLIALAVVTAGLTLRAWARPDTGVGVGEAERRGEDEPDAPVDGRDFIDELGRLREEGRALRREVTLPPRDHPARLPKEILLRGPKLIPHEDAADNWARRVRVVLGREAPRFLVLFDQGGHLPEHGHTLRSMTNARVTREYLESYLDDKLANLDRILSALHRGR